MQGASPPWVQREGGISYTDNFKRLIKLAESWSYFHYYHAPVIVNTVSDKIPLPPLPALLIHHWSMSGKRRE